MKKSQVARSIEKLEKLPSFIRGWAKNYALGSTVPYVGRSGLNFIKTTPNEWVAELKNRRKVQNHLKQIHACGMILIAESIGVLITAMNLSADAIPLVKSIDAQFVKRSTGSMVGRVQLTDEQIEYIKNTPKGELELNVKITDEAGVQPILIKVTSAWVPKKRKK